MRDQRKHIKLPVMMKTGLCSGTIGLMAMSEIPATIVNTDAMASAGVSAEKT